MTWVSGVLFALAPVLDPSVVNVAQLRYAGGEWNPRPHAMRHLLAEAERRTSVITGREPRVVTATDAALSGCPLLYWAGGAAMAPLGEAEVAILRRYIKSGGTIFIDASDEAFTQSARGEIKRILPESHWNEVPPAHVLYKTFYLVSHPSGRQLEYPFVEAISEEDRLAVILSRNDAGGAWARDDLGRWEFEVAPGGDSQREMAIRFGVNVLLYALCLDYKNDQVHIPFIMRRRR